MTHSRTHIIQLLNENELKPSRALGQNFVADANTVRRIVRLAGISKEDHVIEIGAGLGSLTLALTETGANVTAIEVDKHVLPVLKKIVEPLDVSVVEADALQINWDTLTSPDKNYVVVANLPYNVGTSIVTRILDTAPQVKRLLVMVQKEVAERLAAPVGVKSYGALSVKVQYWANAKIVGYVPPTVFIPQPDVDSALVEINRLDAPRIDPLTVDPEFLFKLVKAGFGQRRKMLRRSLAGVVSLDALHCAGINPTSRAEELDVYAWGELARCCKNDSKDED